MPRKLPPLNGLRAFEAAARHLSFTKAADELHVTPAAVSQQVKALEEYCGCKLFRRLTRALLLTDTGQEALPALRKGFDALEEAAKILSSFDRSRSLSVSVAPTFGAKWLVPRLGRFSAAHPDLELRIDASEALADFESDGVDVAIRYGRGDYPKLHSECLVADIVVPVCSPVLLESELGLREPKDLANYKLLHVAWRLADESAPNWRMWLRAAKVEDIDAERGPRFTIEGLAIQAAIEGQGVALISSTLVTDDLEAGRLVRPFAPAVWEETAFSFYLVCPRNVLNEPKIQAFRQWMKAEVAASSLPV